MYRLLCLALVVAFFGLNATANANNCYYIGTDTCSASGDISCVVPCSDGSCYNDGYRDTGNTYFWYYPASYGEAGLDDVTVSNAVIACQERTDCKPLTILNVCRCVPDGWSMYWGVNDLDTTNSDPCVGDSGYGY
jgi:hypothetical protein